MLVTAESGQAKAPPSGGGSPARVAERGLCTPEQGGTSRARGIEQKEEVPSGFEPEMEVLQPEPDATYSPNIKLEKRPGTNEATAWLPLATRDRHRIADGVYWISSVHSIGSSNSMSNSLVIQRTNF